MKRREFNHHTMHNGIRIVHRPDRMPLVHLGLFILAGSRNERPSEHGLAHFIEHVVFKGTNRRKSFQIFNRIEHVGGELNAFTTKEETCIHASVLGAHFARACELLADVLLNSTFPHREIEKEKDIVIDEINYYRDVPDESIFDDFEELVFAGHPLGRNILGNPQRIRTFSRSDIRRFMSRNYSPERIVLSIAGGDDFREVVRQAERYFGSMPAQNSAGFPKFKPPQYKKSEKTQERKISQTHCIIGCPAFPHHHPHRLGFVLLNNLLGGPASNSRLNMAVRERHGLAYNIESNYVPFADTGLFSVYFSTENGSADRVCGIVQKELRRLYDQPLGTLQLSRAKSQLKGQIALSFESRMSEMLSMGKSCLIYNTVDSVDSICKRIDGLDASTLRDIAAEILNFENFTRLTYLTDGNQGR